jgi:hypothetical protein
MKILLNYERDFFFNKNYFTIQQLPSPQGEG